MESNFVAIHEKFPAAAEYLSCIYIINRDYGYVTNVKIAEWLGVSSSAVTQAVGRLKRLDLVRQKRYENVLLSETGRSMAVQVLRRHYLLEHLLVRLLGYPWDKADEEAKRLQTAISEDLTDYLYGRLGAPQTCPHGNPMPGCRVEKGLLTAPTLRQAFPVTKVKILRITEEGEGIPGMLSFCDSHGVRPGARFVLASRDENMIYLSAEESFSDTADGIATFPLPLDLADHIRYEPAVES